MIQLFYPPLEWMLSMTLITKNEKKPYQKIFICKLNKNKAKRMCVRQIQISSRSLMIKNKKKCTCNVELLVLRTRMAISWDSHKNLNLFKSNSRKSNIGLKLMWKSKTQSALTLCTKEQCKTTLAYQKLTKWGDKPHPQVKSDWLTHSHFLWYHHAASGIEHCEPCRGERYDRGQRKERVHLIIAKTKLNSCTH